MRMPFILAVVFFALSPLLSRADDWALTASNSIPYGSLCHDGRSFIAWGANDQGDTVFSISPNGHNWAEITSAVPLSAFAACQGQYVGVRVSDPDILLVRSTNLVDWADSSIVYTLLMPNPPSYREYFRSALISVSESNVVVRLEVQPAGWYSDVYWILRSAQLGADAWSLEYTTGTHFLIYDGRYFWRCTGMFHESTAYRSRTGTDWEQCPSLDTSGVNSLSVDRGMAVLGARIFSLEPLAQVPVYSFQGGAHYMSVPYTGLYDRVYFNSPVFCLTAADETTGSPLLVYTTDGSDWRRQSLPVSLSAFAASSNTIVGVGQGLFYAFNKTAALSSSTNAVRVSGLAIDVASSTAHVRGIAPSGTVIEVQGTTTLGPDAEWSPLWIPSVATGGCTDLNIPVAVSSQLFMRAVTIGAR